MLTVSTQNHDLVFGERFSLNFQRTLRIPDDGKTYPLPPGLGKFPICKVEDYAERVPKSWVKHGGVFIPMYQREALWMLFRNVRPWQPVAVKIAVGKINAVSGKDWSQNLRGDEKDYVVCPPQPWLDGINTGKDMIRQFVAMPLGMGYTVEGQVTGTEEHGGVQIIVYAPKPGKFPDQLSSSPVRMYRMPRASSLLRAINPGSEMGLAAGGKMRQKIYKDDHGVDTWDTDNYGRVYVHIVNSMMYREITGEEPPPTPVTAQHYAQHKLPWFDLYDEHKSDIAAPDTLQQVKSVKEMDAEKGFAPQQDDSSVDVPDDKIIKYKVDDEVQDGDW